MVRRIRTVTAFNALKILVFVMIILSRGQRLSNAFNLNGILMQQTAGWLR
jgi:hypothetical protein